MKTAQQLVVEITQGLSPRSKDQNQTEASEPSKLCCRSCDKEWEQSHWSMVPGASYSSECKECALKRRLEIFNTICPPLYQKTDVNLLPQTQLKKALDWKFGPRGLILLGETGLGKSRVAWTLLKRVLTEDKERKFDWFDSISFGHEISKHYREENAESWLEIVAKTPILFFDDLGKLKLTERAEVELFGLIEKRCANELPVIVTTNDTGDSLASRMSDNRGPAMIRRLREFCEPIQF